MRKWHARFHSGHGSKTSSILTRSDLLKRQDHSMLDDHSPQGWSLLSLSPRGQRGLPQPLDKALKLLRRRSGLHSELAPRSPGGGRSQIGTALANRVLRFGVRVIQRLRRSSGSAATVTNPGLSNGFRAAVYLVRSIATKDATAAIAGGWGRFSDISSESFHWSSQAIAALRRSLEPAPLLPAACAGRETTVANQ